MEQADPTTKPKRKKKKKTRQDGGKARLRCFPEILIQQKDGETSEQLAVRKLKSRLLPLSSHPTYASKLDQSDAQLIKWLKVSQWNVMTAACKIRKSMEFRKKMNMDTFLENYQPPEVLKMFYAGGICGEDKEGSPVCYELPGFLDINGFIRSVSRSDMKDFRLYQYEMISQYLKNMSHLRGKTIDSILLVIDMKDAKLELLQSPSFILWTEAATLLNNYYPGLIKEVLIIRPSGLLSELYLSLRPYLGQTVHLLTVVGINFLKFLTDRIEPHQIPAYLGGYKCDFDNNPWCRENIQWPNALIREWQYFSDEKMAADVLTIEVPAGGHTFHELHLAQRETTLIWEVMEVTHPFEFAIYRDVIGGRENAIFPKIKYCSESKSNGVQCTHAGRYFLLFDNWKDLARSLTVKIRIRTVVPSAIRARLGYLRPLGDRINFYEPMGEEECEMRELFFKKAKVYTETVGTCIGKIKIKDCQGLKTPICSTTKLPAIDVKRKKSVALPKIS